MRSWWLGKKKGKEAFIVPSIVDGRVSYTIGHDPEDGPSKDDDGTVGRLGATCVACGSAVALKYIREQGKAHGLREQLMAVVAEGMRQRVYASPDAASEAVASVPIPADVPLGELATNTRDFKTPNYGMNTFASLFTNRQLTALTTFSDLVVVVRERVFQNALDAGLPEGDRLEQGGTGSAAYADAVATYLGLSLSRCLDYSNALCTWHHGRETIRNLFARQAVPMAWIFETNLFSDSTGNFVGQVAWVSRAIDTLPVINKGVATQADAASRTLAGVISTDPPYYDNIGSGPIRFFLCLDSTDSTQDLPQPCINNACPKGRRTRRQFIPTRRKGWRQVVF